MFKYYLFVRDFWISIFNTIFAFLENIIIIPYKIFVIKNYKGAGTIHIIGTGPSLKKDMMRFVAKRKKKDNILCVNHFASTDTYEKLKPNLYLLCDSAFFSAATSHVNDICELLIDSLIKKTNWKLNLIIPISKIKSPVIDRLKANTNIKIYFLNNIPITGGSCLYNAFLYRIGMATPLYQNVLNAATYFSIKSGFDKIYIWGADHNWMEERTVLPDNRMYSYNKHFYSEEIEQMHLMNVPNVYGQLENVARCLRAYHEMRKYADMKKISIINCSSVSWIDAFEREHK